jgi:exopolysaccharide production protein ExoQ
VAWLIASDVRRHAEVSSAVWIPVIWVVLMSSRPVASWFSWGAGAGGVAEAYDEGNPFDRWVYFVLMLLATSVLMRRRVTVGQLLRANQWVVIFFVYCAFSITWSDAPNIAVKRWLKDFGNILMVVVVLTEARPTEAVRALFFRVASILVPLSVVLVKFFGELGRAYHVWSGEMMYTGVATHKNSLGAFAMLCCLYLVWGSLPRPRGTSHGIGVGITTSDVVLLLLTIWLLVIARSATALSCTAVGVLTLLGLRVKAVRANIWPLGLAVLSIGLILWVLDSSLGLSEYIIVDLLGRDMTLTTRTEVWPVLVQHAQSVAFGAGFNSFWSGDRLRQLYSKFGIIQAHNGYLETFLNVGLVGFSLLVMVLMSSIRRLKRALVDSPELSTIQMVILIVAVIYNFSEATFSKMSPLWFALLLTLVWCGPGSRSLTRSKSIRSQRYWAGAWDAVRRGTTDTSGKRHY